MRPSARAAALAAALALGAARAENPAEVLELPQVLVVGTTLLPGSGVALRKLPANAQIYTSAALRRQGVLSLTDFLEGNATGLTLNSAQGNPHQPDLNLRGFSASPLLGTPQGLSVFVDGVRVNEPFGDSVNWDLLPAAAISSIQLIPGSNPAFGLNTLGGAIALYTKSGSSAFPEHPGGSISLGGGSSSDQVLGFEAGGVAAHWDWFITGQQRRDRGWAQHNASLVQQLFAKLGWQNDTSDLDLTLQLADNRLEGTQTLPRSIPDIRQAYTWPDVNRNRLAALALKGSQALAPGWLLSGNAYLRDFRNANFSSNVNPDYGADDPVQARNAASGIDQRGAGAGLQLTRSGSLGGAMHQLTIGLGLDTGHAGYTLRSQDAAFTADRGTQGVGDFELRTDAASTTRNLGLYLSEALSLGERWTLSLAGRLNQAHVSIADRSGNAPALNGAHRFQRFNPALGLSFHPDAAFTAYAALNEGVRAPTAIELSCADPQAPCQLPNSFLSDPPLAQVVSKTIEGGARGTLADGVGWSLAWFRTELHDDLQFVSSSGVAANAGYFQNVGTTRRQGLELGATGRWGLMGLALHYSRIDATYRSGFVEHSPSNSTADANGAIVVRPGDRLPGIARDSFKLRLDLTPRADWNFGLNLVAASSVQARGDENNRDANGPVGGWSVLNLDARHDWSHSLSFHVRIENLFDRRYANFGILGQNAFTGPGGAFDGANARREQFRGHGAPRRLVAGLQYSL